MRLTKSGPRRYVQLVESYRNDKGRVKQHTIASLGRLEAIDRNFDSAVGGLERATGRMPGGVFVETPPSDPDIAFEPNRTLGDVWTLTGLWSELGFDRLSPIIRSTKRRLDVEAMLRMMLLSRLCDPESKLGMLRWLESPCMPGIQSSGVAHQHLLPTMDSLLAKREKVDEVLTSLLPPLIDQELSVVLYHLTTISTVGISEQSEHGPRCGMS